MVKAPVTVMDVAILDGVGDINASLDLAGDGKGGSTCSSNAKCW